MTEQSQESLLSVEIPIRWGDMDAYGHVNNAMYFRYMEEARVQLLHRLGGSLDPRATGPVIVNAQQNKLVTRGSAKVVWVDHRVNQSVELPAQLRRQIEAGVLSS